MPSHMCTRELRCTRLFTSLLQGGRGFTTTEGEVATPLWGYSVHGVKT